MPLGNRKATMNWRRAVLVLSIGAVSVAPAGGSMPKSSTVTETFDGTVTEATWRLGTLDEVVASGGSPGGYLRNRQLDAAIPTPIHVGTLPSPFLGNYRSADVISVGLDVNVFAASIGVDSRRTISLVLGSDMGTPDDPTDDCEAYVVGVKPVPRPGAGWRPYDFRVPADEATLPTGWAIRGGCAGLDENAAWNAVLENVTRVTFPFSDPGTFWFFQVWDVGIDNVRISFGVRGQ
jgi:hypothetical protein